MRRGQGQRVPARNGRRSFQGVGDQEARNARGKWGQKSSRETQGAPRGSALGRDEMEVKAE
eukprot:13207903-Alexandrium_andersonii.AAC.1